MDQIEWMRGAGDLSPVARARVARREELRLEIEGLRGRRARSQDPATHERLDARIRRAEARLGRA